MEVGRIISVGRIESRATLGLLKHPLLTMGFWHVPSDSPKMVFPIHTRSNLPGVVVLILARGA